MAQIKGIVDLGSENPGVFDDVVSQPELRSFEDIPASVIEGEMETPMELEMDVKCGDL